MTRDDLGKDELCFKCSFYNGSKCLFYYKGQCGLAIQFKVWGEKFRKDLDDAIIYEKEKTE